MPVALIGGMPAPEVLDPNLDPEHQSRLPAADMNLYRAALACGWATYRNTGSVFFPELIISGTLRCLRDMDGKTRAFYDNNYRINLRRHVFLLGDKDTKKGSMIDVWRRCLPIANYVEMGETDKIIEMTAQGRTTWEAMVGGAQDGQLILGSAIGTDIITVEEAMSFFGHNKQSMMRMVDNLNGALQEGDVINDVKNMKIGSMKAREEFRQLCEQFGVKFNTVNCVMRLTFTQTLILASREPDFEAWMGMLDSGFISRMAVADCSFDPIVEDQYYRNQMGEEGDGEQFVQRIKDQIDTLWSCRFKEINYPPMKFVTEANNEIMDEYAIISRQTGLRLKSFKTGREMQYIAQVMTFNVIQRLLADGLKPGTTVERLEYTEEDRDYALAHWRKFMLPYIERRSRQAIRSSSTNKHLEEIIQVLRTFIHAKAREAGVDADPTFYQRFPSSELIEFYVEDHKISQSTAHHRVSLMEEAGLITVARRGKHGERHFEASRDFIETECKLLSIQAVFEERDARFDAYSDFDYQSEFNGENRNY